MSYKKALQEYIADCEVALEDMNSILNNPEKDVTLTTCERFDYNFKKGLVSIRNMAERKTGRLSKLFPKNIYNPTSLADYAAQMFYKVLSTADDYTFEDLKDVAELILYLSKNLTSKVIKCDFVESRNTYNISVTVGEETVTYQVLNPDMYVIFMCHLITETFYEHPNKMVENFYKTYLSNEKIKIDRNIAPTPYVEFAEGVKLSDYYVKRKKYGVGTGKTPYNRSDCNISVYKGIASINEELSGQAYRKVTPALPEKSAEKTEEEILAEKRAEEVVDSMFLTPMGNLRTTGKATNKDTENIFNV